MSGKNYETTYGVIKRGYYGTRRYPWGSNKGPSAEGRPQNSNGILTSPYNFFTSAGNLQALPRYDQRRFLQIQNMSLANDISFAFDGAASATDGITLSPGQVEIFDVACPIGALNIWCSTALQRVAILEGA